MTSLMLRRLVLARLARIYFERPSSPQQGEAPRIAPGRHLQPTRLGLQPIEDLIGPEPLEPMQRLVEGRELLGVDAADLLDRANVFLVERLHDVAHLAALVGEPDADRAAIDARTLVVEEAHLHELLQIVGDVR